MSSLLSPTRPFAPGSTVAPPGTRPRRSRRLPPRSPVVLAVVVTTIVVVVVVVGGVAALAYRSWSHSPANARAGDCLGSISADPGDGSGDRTRIVECDSAEARYQILATDSTHETCLDVPGTDTYHDGFCLVTLEEGTDPAQTVSAAASTAVNTVQEGDCVTSGDLEGTGAASPKVARSGCTAGSYPVQVVIRGLEDLPRSPFEEYSVPDLTTPGAAPRTTQELQDEYVIEQCRLAGADPATWYGWNLAERQPAHMLAQPVSSYDIVLCLGEPVH